MEEIHKSSIRTWISGLINVKQFRDEWVSCFPKHETRNIFGNLYSAEECSEMEEQCGLDAMRCNYQHLLEISKELDIPENVSLETLNIQKEDIEKRKKDQVYDKAVHIQFKDSSYPQRKIPGFDDPSTNEFEPVEEPNVLLRVQIFKPETNPVNDCRTMLMNYHVDQEFMVLGSQFLTELRDKIICVSDKAIPGDYSDMPHEPPGDNCGAIYKSGFFYIDGVFYNDLRYPECRDYSENIISWSQTKAKGIGPFKKSRMEETRFIDLNIQLGYPYLYTHQGNCEHLIVINDLLLFTHHYSNNKFDYPVHVGLKPKRRSACMICHIHSADWIVYDNKRLPVNPFFFCKTCFQSFNYDGKHKIGSFQAFHHIDRSLIL